MELRQNIRVRKKINKKFSSNSIINKLKGTHTLVKREGIVGRKQLYTWVTASKEMKIKSDARNRAKKPLVARTGRTAAGQQSRISRLNLSLSCFICSLVLLLSHQLRRPVVPRTASHDRDVQLHTAVTQRFEPISVLSSGTSSQNIHTHHADGSDHHTRGLNTRVCTQGWFWARWWAGLIIAGWMVGTRLISDHFPVLPTLFLDARSAIMQKHLQRKSRSHTRRSLDMQDCTWDRCSIFYDAVSTNSHTSQVCQSCERLVLYIDNHNHL